MVRDALMIALEADLRDAEDGDVTVAALEAALAERRARRGGRPRGSTTSAKSQIAIRIDNDVLAHFRAQGAGWQTRVNAVLRKAAGL
ncbi:MAG: BrnA antitoxin family protein [Sphingomonas fennica]